ncbi:hypothetical protein pb186bvf_010131 [Paramecium bursaria]
MNAPNMPPYFMKRDLFAQSINKKERSDILCHNRLKFMSNIDSNENTSELNFDTTNTKEVLKAIRNGEFYGNSFLFQQILNNLDSNCSLHYEVLSSLVDQSYKDAGSAILLAKLCLFIDSVLGILTYYLNNGDIQHSRIIIDKGQMFIGNMYSTGTYTLNQLARMIRLFTRSSTQHKLTFLWIFNNLLKVLQANKREIVQLFNEYKLFDHVYSLAKVEKHMNLENKKQFNWFCLETSQCLPYDICDVSVLDQELSILICKLIVITNLTAQGIIPQSLNLKKYQECFYHTNPVVKKEIINGLSNMVLLRKFNELDCLIEDALKLSFADGEILLYNYLQSGSKVNQSLKEQLSDDKTNI